MQQQQLLLMQRAVTVASAVSSEQGIEIDVAANDSAETFVERVRALPPAQRHALVEKLGGVILALFAFAEFLTRARAFAAAGTVFGLTLAVYVLRGELTAEDQQ